ncbi:unnamed protein product [Ophioblennius macclurei]
MKTSLACVFFFLQLFAGSAEMIFKRLTAGQTLSLSCHLQQDPNSPTDLHLYHRATRSQTTVLSVAKDGNIKVDPDRRARTQLHGGLNSLEVNVTISPLELGDTGLYVLELNYQVDNGSDQVAPCAPKTFLLVETSGGNSCPSSLGYPPLLLTIFSAAAFLLLILVWLAAEKCMKMKQHRRTRPHAPIYEEMGWKQQRSESPQNNCEAPSHLEEVHFPVYANPQRQPQDNYYACPRQLAALRA